MLKKVPKWVWSVLGFVAVFVGAVVIRLLLVQAAWSWVIPDIFPGAVESGFVLEKITMFQAFKLGVLLGVFGLTCAARTKKS